MRCFIFGTNMGTTRAVEVLRKRTCANLGLATPIDAISFSVLFARVHSEKLNSLQSTLRLVAKVLHATPNRHYMEPIIVVGLLQYNGSLRVVNFHEN
eukprot:m.465691 g.465691  ORF g.465691 m.465691 type:complete len:97 (-) comp24473_c0_seq1:3430-3720(-)